MGVLHEGRGRGLFLVGRDRLGAGLYMVPGVASGGLCEGQDESRRSVGARAV